MRKLITMVLCVLLGVSQLSAQNRTIRGKVSDAQGNPIANASVLVKGSTTGTTTGTTGEYSITVPTTARTLVISSLNFVSQEVSIGNRTTVDVSLVTTAQDLQEVVVVGYGTAKKKSDVTGSVTTISAATVQDKPVANVLDALQGKVPGVQVYTSSGEPSATPSIRINGVGSLTSGTTPLFILDGIPVSSGTLLSLNPEDFESVTVLRDASATSIYGSRAANGVIVFTTKKGSLNTSKIGLEVQYGISNMTNNTAKMFNTLMTTPELQAFQLASGQFTQAQLDARAAAGYTHNTKWSDVYYKDNTPTYQVNLNVSGGGGKTTYYISGSYFEQGGIAWRSDYKRYSLRSNLNTNVNNWFQMGMNLFGGYDERQTNPYGSNQLNRGLSPLLQPYYSPVDANGNDVMGALIPGLGLYHPRYLAENIQGVSNNLQLNPSAYIQLSPVKGLTIRSQAGFDAYDWRTTGIRLPSYVGSLNNGQVTESFERGVQKTITNTAEYQKRIGDMHSFTVLGGQEFIKNVTTAFNGASTGQTDDRLLTISTGSSTTQTAGSSKTEYSFLSYFGRLGYNYDGKYFVDASARYDESSRFGRGLKGASFYSGGLMWHAKKEAFMDNIVWLTDLRVKASLGTTGNSSGIGNYDALALVGTNNYNGNIGWSLNTAGNPLLSWETKRQLNIGFQATLWNKVNLEVEYFNTMTNNMIVSVPVPLTTGFSDVNTNVGNLKNTGLNFNVTYDAITKRDASLSFYVNGGIVNQEITELFQGRNYWIIPNTGVSWVVGQPVNFLYPIWSGVNPNNGNAEWYLPVAGAEGVTQTRKDPAAVTSTFNTANLQQNTGIKRFAPFNGGFGMSGRWKQFSIQADFTFSQGKYLINNDQYFFENPNQFSGYNQSRNVNDFWKKAGDVTRFPRYGVQFTQFDSRLIQNASFMRLKNLTIAYDINKNLLGKTGVISAARFYVTFRNMWTLTKYPGPDPEVDSNITLGAYPNTQQVAFGLNLSF